ncbi:MAG: hypothetical protein [Bacteriophage sp.]|nr:MAG: hypothetical protein [Bacteriophage sp.]
MLSALERAKLLKKLKDLAESKVDLTGVAKAKVLKQIIETRALLGFSNEVKEQQNPNAVYQAVLDGEKVLSVETLQEMLSEANADPEHYQLVPATQKLLDEFNSSNRSKDDPNDKYTDPIEYLEKSEDYKNPDVGIEEYLTKTGFIKSNSGAMGLNYGLFQIYPLDDDAGNYQVNYDGRKMIVSNDPNKVKTYVRKKRLNI